jgi:sec-independent protein translocase protein TatA
VDEKYLIVILIIAILFGASRLPSLGRNFGKGIREFKRGIADSTHDDAEEAPAAPKDAEEAPAAPPEEDRRTAD